MNNVSLLIVSGCLLLGCATAPTYKDSVSGMQVYQDRIYDAAGKNVGQQERRVFTHKEEVIILDKYGRMKQKYIIRRRSSND